MSDRTGHPAAGPVFKKCARCGYSLRGLPANHACPECGLRFDEHCGLYRVKNPKVVIAVWLCIFGGGTTSLIHLPHVANLASASAWQKFGALAAVVWVLCVAMAIPFMVKLYRRGQEVAVTGDGLIIRLADFDDKLIPWTHIGGASVKDQPEGKPQIASVFLKDKQKNVEVGGLYNVFPKRADVERFVDQVNHHLRAVNGEQAR